MKRFVVLICVLISATTQALEVEIISRVMNVPVNDLAECLQKNRLTTEDIEDLENIFDDQNASLSEYSSNFGCFVTCVFEKSHIIENNQIQLNSLIELAKRNKFPLSEAMKQKLRDCIDEAEQEDDECKIGLTFSSCLIHKLRQ